jgi:CHASE2 domain-containing sensor protein
VLKPSALARPFGFAQGRPRAIFLTGVAPVLITAAFALFRPGGLQRFDSTVYDAVLKSARTPVPSSQIVIVEVDNRSLSSFGQWPWRRDLVATLIERLREAGASVIALDIIFAEPDRSGPAPDDALADTLRKGRVILGYGLTFDGRPDPRVQCDLHPLGIAIRHARASSPDGGYFRASGAVCNLPALARAAGASAFLNAAPDADGILRRVPLVAELDGHIYPSLALAATSRAAGASQFILEASGTGDPVLSIDDRAVPIDRRSHMLLRYRGPKRTFQYVSAADVLSGSAGRQALGDKIVLVGVTALGTFDMVSTPFDTLFPGIEVQATAADILVQRDFIQRTSAGRIAEAAVTLAAGVGVAAVFARFGIVSGIVGGGVAIVLLFSGAIWLLGGVPGQAGVFVSPLFPSLAVTSSLPLMTLARFAFERRRADRAGRERTAARKLMIQTLLSLTEVRDAETGRHSLRTQRYARLLAEELSNEAAFQSYLTRERIDLLSSLAPLHDIGKVGIPDHILNKPGALTADELAEMRKHPTLGRDVIVNAERRVDVRDDETLAMAKEIVYTHHERWDGSGYPQGLQGRDVPLPGRIMAVVDVYDATTTRTLYRAALSHEDTVSMIVRGKGTHFDPAVIDAFVRVAPEFQRVSQQDASANG